jgi:D-glycero-D-manno-heptose 1,7-bisphosphate phosphatase
VGRAVFLDRDGVINEESRDYVKRVDEWHPIPGSLEAIARLSRAGFDVVVLTNQSGIGRGLYDEASLQSIHRALIGSVEALGGSIRGIFHCPHLPEAGCGCRKPKPGLIERAERELGLHAPGTPMVGDRLSDLTAARAKGCRPILVRTGRGEIAAREAKTSGRLEIYADLAAAVDALLATS